jgi:hypothetical protein
VPALRCPPVAWWNRRRDAALDAGPKPQQASRIPEATLSDGETLLATVGFLGLCGLVLWALTRRERSPLAPPGLIALAFFFGSVGFFPSARPGVVDYALISATGLLGVATSVYLTLRTLDPDWAVRYGEGRAAGEFAAKTVELVLVLCATTMGFALITAVLLHLHAVTTTAPVTPHAKHYTVPQALFGFYFWHLCNLIPLFDITGTLRWRISYGFADTSGGLLLLAYKLLVAAPIIQVIRLGLTARQPRAKTSQPA